MGTGGFCYTCLPQWFPPVIAADHQLVPQQTRVHLLNAFHITIQASITIITCKQMYFY